LKDLSQLRFLVLDEADRMTQEHSFPQLVQILDSIHQANPRDEDEEEEDSEDEEDNDDSDRLLGLPGIRGEARLTMLTDDILEQVEAQRNKTRPETMDLPESDFPDEQDDEELQGDKLLVEAQPKVHRQTFIYSATLTLPFTSTKPSTSNKKRRKKLNLDGGIAEILQKTRAMGETKVVDLSSSSSSSSSVAPTAGVRLPPGLRLEQIKCTQKHKDSHLYAYLMTTVQGTSGPCLIFCNSIAAVRRVGTTLQTLGMSVRILHAHMQQVRPMLSLYGSSKGVDERTRARRDIRLFSCVVKRTNREKIQCGLLT
jgi:ATP-dependent RNA helicase DDX24/MAK5